MKKIFSLFAAVLMAGSMMAETSVYEHTFSTSAKTFTADEAQTLSNVSWTLATTWVGTDKDYNRDTNNPSQGMKIGSNNKAIQTMTLTTSGISGVIDSIYFETNARSGAAVAMSVTVGGTAYAGPASFNGTGAFDTRSKLTYKGNSTGEIVLSWDETDANASKKGAFYLTVLKVYSHTAAPVVTPVVLAGAATAEAINVTTESTGTWYGNVLSATYYAMYAGMSMTPDMMVVSLASMNADAPGFALYTGNKTFNIADLTFNDAELTPGTYYFIAGGLVADAESSYGFSNNGEAIVVEFTVAEPVTGCDWAHIDWLGNGSGNSAYTNKFKGCAGENINEIVNIQTPGFATKPGIYVTAAAPLGAITACDFVEGGYDIQGGGIILHCDAFTAIETEVTLTCALGTAVVTIYYADGSEDAPLTFTFTDGEDAGAVTITPSEEGTKAYVYGFCNDALLALIPICSTEEDLINYYINSFDAEDIVAQFEEDVEIDDWFQSTFMMSATSGTYDLWVVEVSISGTEGDYTLALAGEVAHHEVVYAKVLSDFKGTVVLNPKGFRVNGLEEYEDYFVYYMMEKELYDEFSVGRTDDDLIQMTVGNYLPNYEDFELYYFTAGQVVQYAHTLDNVFDEGGAGDYVLLVANADIMTGLIGSHAVKYVLTLDATGAIVTTGMENVELEGVAKAIKNGQFVIIKNGVRYNAVGAKL